ncbi:unnamed protein product [Diamesa serratosioi]
MKFLVAFSLLLTVAAAGVVNNGHKHGNHNHNDWNRNYNNGNNDLNVDVRDGNHQKFILELVHHLQQDVQRTEFIKYTTTIRLDNKGDYKDLNKVYKLVSLYRNGMFEQRGKPFSLYRERNVITTKALFDFLNTCNDWNTLAMNLIWARCNVNEYQFWNVLSLLVVHNKHMDNIVLPAAYEVLPQNYFTVDVIDVATTCRLTGDCGDLKHKQVIMAIGSNGVLGSITNDDKDNVDDLNDKTDDIKIRDWDSLKKVMNDIKNIKKNSRHQNTNIINNNQRNTKQGNKFNNNGEDRMCYYTEDVGLNNFYYWNKVDNSRILDNTQMYNNKNNGDNEKLHNGRNGHNDDDVDRRGERYLYTMQQMLARFNLERLSNGLDNVKDVSIDSVIENGAFPKLQYTNGLQFPNRHNNYKINNQQNEKLIQIVKDYENRIVRAIDQGFIETVDGQRIDLTHEDGINKLGNLIQENRDTDNERYYSSLEFFLRILLGGNYRMDVDHTDDRFVPSTLENIETSMRDPVYWQMTKRITNLMDKLKRTLSGYKTDDVDFNNVRIKNVNVDKLVTYFDYFDSDITNAIDVQLTNNTMSLINNMLNDNVNDDNNCDRNGNCRGQNNRFNNRNNNRDNNRDSNESDSNESLNNNDSNEVNCDRHGKCCDHNGVCFYKNQRNMNKNWNKDWDMNKNKNWNKDWDMNKNWNKDWNMNKNWYKNWNKDWNMNTMDNKRQMSNQRNWWNRDDNIDESNIFNYNIIARQRRLTAKTFTVTVNIDSKVNQNGIVRIFLGPKIDNKQQLNDNRKNFVEIDQFKVQLNQGENTIRRNSRNFRNVVNDPITFTTLYKRALNTKSNNQGTDMNDNNMETNNNNMGFPHRLVLPKGTVGGMDYTIFVIVTNTHGNTNNNNGERNNMNINRGLNNKWNRNNNVGHNSDESDSNSNEQDKYGKDFNVDRNGKRFNNRMNSNEDSNERYGNMINKHGRNHNSNNKNMRNVDWNTKYNRYGNNNYDLSNESSGSDEHVNDNMNNNRYGSDERYNTRNNNGKTMNNIKNRFVNDWNKMDLNDNMNMDNKMTINTCNGNKNSKLGLDNRALGFPLDREINNVNSFVTDNMFFKDVKIYNMDMNMNMNQLNMDRYNKY